MHTITFLTSADTNICHCDEQRYCNKYDETGTSSDPTAGLKEIATILATSVLSARQRNQDSLIKALGDDV